MAHLHTSDDRLLAIKGCRPLALTQAIRSGLAKRGIAVHGVYSGGIDTDMLAGIDFLKTAPAIVARGILDGVIADQEDIFPDPISEQMSEMWVHDPKAFELAFRGE